MNEVVGNAVELTFAEEALVVDVQILLHELMEEKGMSRADLAKAMGVSRARVSQMLSDECKNLTVRSLARAAFALGDRIEVRSSKRQARETDRSSADSHSRCGTVYSLWARDASFDDLDFRCGGSDDRLDGYLLSQERMAA